MCVYIYTHLQKHRHTDMQAYVYIQKDIQSHFEVKIDR